MKRFLKYMISLMFAFLILLGVGLILSQTQWFRDWVRDTIEDEVSQELGAELHIGDLKGNLFSRAEVIQPALIHEGRVIASASTITATYDIFDLLSSPLIVESIDADSLTVHLSQNQDSIWIWDVLFAPDSEATSVTREPEPESGTGGVVLERVRIARGTVHLTPVDSSSPFPRRADSLALVTSLHITPSGIRIPVQRLAARPDREFPVVRNLSGNLSITSETILIQEVSLTTEKNMLSGTASIDQSGTGASVFSISTSPFDVHDLKPLVSLELGEIRPAIELECTVRNKDVHLDAKLSEGSRRLTLRGEIGLREDQHKYDAVLDIHDVRYPFPDNSDLIAHVKTGHLEVSGTGFDLASLDVTIAAVLDSAVLLGKTVHQFALSGAIHQGSFAGKVEVKSESANISANVSLGDLPGRMTYQGKGFVHGLDLGALLQNDALSSDLNAEFETAGRGLTRAPLELVGAITLSRSSFTDVPIDSGVINLRLQGDTIHLDTAVVQNRFLQAQLSGELTDGTVHPLKARVHVVDSDFLASYAEIDSLTFEGDASATLIGPLESLGGSVQFAFRDLYGEGVSIDSLSGGLNFAGGFDIDSLDGSASLFGISSGSMQLDRMDFLTANTPEGMDATLGFARSDELNGEISSVLIFDSLLTIRIRNVHAQVFGATWKTPGDSAFVSFTDDGIRIRQFILENGLQQIAIDGLVSSSSESKLGVSLKEIDVRELSRLLSISPPVEGTLSSEITGEQLLQNPDIDSRILIRDMQIDTVLLGDLEATIRLRPPTFTWDIGLKRMGAAPLITSGSIPFNGFESEDSAALEIGENRFIRLSTSGFDISQLKQFFPRIDTLSGILTADITASKSGERSQITGFATLKGGALQSSEAGISFPSITASMHGDSTLFHIDTIRIGSTEGSVLASGLIDLSDIRADGRPRLLALNLVARDFLLSNTRAIELKIDGSVTARRQEETLMIGGALRVPRARLWLPSIMSGQAGGPSNRPPPLLVAASQPFDSNGTEEDVSLAIARKGIGTDARGSVQLEIPRNTWIQGRDLNIEISGTLDLRFEGESTQLTGFIRVERGYYTLYGKKLFVKSGRVDFVQGPTLDPTITMELSYEFRREDGERDELILRLSGKALNPTLEFTVNNQPITERDAVSYLLFGRSLDELSQSQKASFNQSTTDLVQGMASSVLSNKLASTVGASLGLDIIEVGFEDDWSRTYITAGKYLSDRLFIRYTSGINSGGSADTRTDEVAIQYELLKFLELQLISGTSNTTGVDVMFKFD